LRRQSRILISPPAFRPATTLDQKAIADYAREKKAPAALATCKFKQQNGFNFVVKNRIYNKNLRKASSNLNMTFKRRNFVLFSKYINKSLK